MESRGEEDNGVHDIVSPTTTNGITPLPNLSISHPGTGDALEVTFSPGWVATLLNDLSPINRQEKLRKLLWKAMWRDEGEPVAELDDLKACLMHATAGGVRSSILAFNIQVCFNLLLAFVRWRKAPKSSRFAIVQDTWRLTAMAGTFTGIYKFLVNALPIVFPPVVPRRVKFAGNGTNTNGHVPKDQAETAEMIPPQRTAKLSLSSRAQMMSLRKETRRWHSALAGAVAGGLAIAWEKSNKRVDIAQQLFVRGLQGSYNTFATKYNINIPQGEILVFCLACGQIMYGLFMRPDTLPRWYSGWIAAVSKLSREFLSMNSDLVHTGTFNVQDLDKTCIKPGITPTNITDLQNFRELFFPSITSPKSVDSSTYIPRRGPCSASHPNITSCRSVPLDAFLYLFKTMLPTYAVIHFVPAILFQWKRFKKDPVKGLVRAGLGSMRSSAFLSIFVTICRSLLCFKTNLHQFLTKLKRSPSANFNPLAGVPQSIIDLLISKGSFWVLGYLGALSLFVEERKRRSELATYSLMKGLESLWLLARGEGLVFNTGKWSGTLLATIGMSMVMSTYHNEPHNLSGFVRRILYQFIGPN